MTRVIYGHFSISGLPRVGQYLMVNEPGLIQVDELMADSRPPLDLPPHILGLARRIAHDCTVPGEYVIHLTIPDRAREPVTFQTARVDVIKEGTVERK